MSLPYSEAVRTAFLKLQSRIRESLLEIDAGLSIHDDEWEREEGGGGKTWAFEKGQSLEKGGINFSDIAGNELPPSATLGREELIGLPFRATGVSVVFHPYNPFVPTSHANVRYFEAGPRDNPTCWWFGGGFDLTPYYPFAEDVEFWHKSAKEACLPFGVDLYPKFKKWCDDYFYLPHRQETRGVGGLFFDDLQLENFDQSLQFVLNVGEVFQKTYFEIFQKRMEEPFGQRQRNFQKYRRGRYAEFNLVYDRGTLFGLQSKGRTESILMSMPPEVSWNYGWIPEEGSPEEDLYKNYLTPKDWLKETK